MVILQLLTFKMKPYIRHVHDNGKGLDDGQHHGGRGRVGDEHGHEGRGHHEAEQDHPGRSSQKEDDPQSYSFVEA